MLVLKDVTMGMRISRKRSSTFGVMVVMQRKIVMDDG